MKKLINKIAYYIWFRTRDNYKEFKRVKKDIDAQVEKMAHPND